MDFHLRECEDCDPTEFAKELAGSQLLNLSVSLPSIGVAGEHLSIAEDYGDALYVGELLNEFDPNVRAKRIYGSATQRAAICFTLRCTRPEELAKTLCGLLPYFAPECFDEEEYEEERQAIYGRILDLTDGVPFRAVRFPDLADEYMLNRVNWMSYDLIGDGDASEWERHLPKQPECMFGFVRSSHSQSLKGECYCSPLAWAIQDTVELPRLLEEYGNDSAEARRLLAAIRMHDSKGSFISNGRVAVRTPDRLFDSPLNMLQKTGRAEGLNPFHFNLSADGSALFLHVPGWIIIDFDASTRLLDQQQLEAALHENEQSTEILRACLGRPTDLRCNWAAVSDEDFELLCWDVLYECGQYEKSSLRKFGASRSRDGGRDLQADRILHARPAERFIFQCKRITTGRSLGATKISVSDVIDQYGAAGFGIMTCTTIDATLHDKLDAIRRNRGITTDLWDLLRIERFLGDHLHIRDRYFKRDQR